MKVGVEVRLADAASFQSILVALGAPPDRKADILPDEQAVVVRVSWVGAKRTNGSFKLIGLDKRVTPPRVLFAAHFDPESTGVGGSSGWGGEFGVLAEHYDWLADAGKPRDRPRHRAVVFLRFYMDMSEADITVALGCRPGTVKSMLYRALAVRRGNLDED